MEQPVSWCTPPEQRLHLSSCLLLRIRDGHSFSKNFACPRRSVGICMYRTKQLKASPRQAASDTAICTITYTASLADVERTERCLQGHHRHVFSGQEWSQAGHKRAQKVQSTSPHQHLYNEKDLVRLVTFVLTTILISEDYQILNRDHCHHVKPGNAPIKQPAVCSGQRSSESNAPTAARACHLLCRSAPTDIKCCWVEPARCPQDNVYGCGGHRGD